MKALLVLMMLAGASALAGETVSNDQHVASTPSVTQHHEASPLIQNSSTTNVTPPKVTYSGLAVSATKRRGSFLQMFNPFAPKKYGLGEENVYHDPKTGKPAGWKIFCVSW